MKIRRFALVLLFSLLVIAPASGWARDRVQVRGTAASFEPPAGYTALTDDEIARKYPSKSAPAQVVGNARRTTSIAFELKPLALTDAKLPETSNKLATGMQQSLPGIHWIVRKFVVMSGQRWLFMELTSKAKDTDIHNIVLLTPYDGKALLFNFNSTRAEFPAVEKQLRASIQTIRLAKR